MSEAFGLVKKFVPEGRWRFCAWSVPPKMVTCLPACAPKLASSVSTQTGNAALLYSILISWTFLFNSPTMEANEMKSGTRAAKRCRNSSAAFGFTQLSSGGKIRCPMARPDPKDDPKHISSP